MQTEELLALMEAHGEAPAEEHHPHILSIATQLAQRLGIQCEAYLRLMVAGLSPLEWRGLF